MKNEEIIKELNTIRELVDFGRYSPAIHNIRILVEKLQPKHRHISSGNLNYSGTYYTCSTCGADIEDEDEELDEPEEKYKCKICGGEINKGEFDTFEVCDGCWDKPETTKEEL